MRKSKFDRHTSRTNATGATETIWPSGPDSPGRARRGVLGAVCGVATVAFLLAGSGVARAGFLNPQVHHPGEFFEKYATPLPYFDGNQQYRKWNDSTGGDPSGNFDLIDIPGRVTGNPTVTYREFRQRVLPESFYAGGGPTNLNPLLDPQDKGTLVWGYELGMSRPLLKM